MRVERMQRWLVHWYARGVNRDRPMLAAQLRLIRAAHGNAAAMLFAQLVKFAGYPPGR